MPRQTRSLARKARDLNSRGILRLPDELLAEIALLFIQLHPAVTDPFDFRNPRPISSVYGWITISHICRRWRAVVIASTRLWSTIRVTTSATWVKTLLERSGQAPLTVTEDTSTTNEKATPAKKLLLNQIERIQHLQLNVDPATCKLFTALASRNADAPILGSLHLHYRDAPYFSISSLPLLSRTSLPHLTRLSLHDRPDERMFRWVPAPPSELVKPLLRPSLTHLSIHRIYDPLSVQDCLEVLRTLRQLEDLALGDVLRRPDEIPNVDPPSEDDLLDLPCLNRIALEGNCLWINGRDSYREYHDTGVAAADLLRHLIIPSTADIFVAVGHERYNEADEGETLAFAFDILKDVAAGKIVATLGSGRQAITSCYAEAYPLSEEIYTTDHFFELLIDLPGGDQSTNVLGSPSGIVWPRKPGQGGSMRCRVRSDCDVLGKSVHDIFARLKPVLSDVRLLHWNCNLRRLGVSSEGRHGIWEGLLVNMSEVQDLIIDGSAAHWVDWMLEKYPGWVYEDVRPVLPCLRTLAVDGAEANWSPGYIYSWQSPNEYTRRHVYYCDRADLTGVLLGALQDWSEWHGGRKLEKLIITDTDCVSEEDMREIISSGFTSSVQCSFMESESEKDEEEDVAEDQTSDI